MIVQHLARVERAGWIVLMAGLSLCVFIQMLGVPATLLDMSGFIDNSVGSGGEGFSILPTLPRLTVSMASTLASDSHLSLHGLVFPTALFHPPSQ